jgi:hypothetical protein
MTIKTILQASEKFLIDNSPGILTGLGVAGTVTTAVLTGKAAYSSALDIQAEWNTGGHKNNIPAKDKIALVWKNFIPPAAVGVVTIAAIIGAVPIALGYGADGASRRPLGLVIVGGLVVSQFITLFITPVIYLYLEEFQEKVLNRTSFFRSGHIPATIKVGDEK